MAEKHTDKKLYRVIRKDGSHLNIEYPKLLEVLTYCKIT